MVSKRRRSRSALRALADAVGIVTTVGPGSRPPGDEALRRVLRAMGFEVSTERAARAALSDLDRGDRARVLAPVRVVRVRSKEARAVQLAVPAALLASKIGSIGWSLEILAEDGDRHVRSGAARGAKGGVIRARIGVDLPPGYHELRAQIAVGEKRIEARQRLIVTPGTCLQPGELLGRDKRAVGISCNLYTLRSERNFGFGDLGDLARLGQWAAAGGADFVGVNPLHAIRNTSDERSPYSPISRLFRNPLYIHIPAVPELRHEPVLRRRLASARVERRLAQLRSASELDYPGIAAFKEGFLRPLHRQFARVHRDRPTSRGRAYAKYLEEHGQQMTDFATFVVFDRAFRARKKPVWDWRKWPKALRDPYSAATVRERRRNFEAFDFQRWMQFELDRQLAAASRSVRRRGAGLGLYLDLAISSVANGCETWSRQELFAHGVSLGAPPDAFTASGQVWGIPPLNPRALRADGYRFWTHVLRASMRHAGILRIDHVIGLVRQFWVPAGASGRDGVFVRFPSDDLFGILALESRRNGCIIVGEDLGVIPKELPPQMRRHGVLGSRVLVFERTRGGGFKRPGTYPRQTMAVANTHDHVPLAGCVKGADLPLLRRLGFIGSDRDLLAATRQRQQEVRSLLRLLRREGILTRGDDQWPLDDERLFGAVHAFLLKTPSVLVAASLDDLSGETEPVNVPSITSARYPVWSRRMHTPLKAIIRLQPHRAFRQTPPRRK